MSVEIDPELRDALDKQAIHDVCMYYCRAVDRLDADLLERVFHDDATVEYGVYDGPASGFVEHMFSLLEGLERTYHCIGNELVAVDGDSAVGEIYVFAYLGERSEAGLTDRILVGRYLDRYERRDGRWRIAHRKLVVDWNHSQPGSAEWEEGMYGELRARGVRGKEDPVYTFLS